MKLWDWAITGPLRFVWAMHRHPTRGQVKARTRSEARALIRDSIGGRKIPAGLIIY